MSIRRKRFLILALVLFTAGAVGLGWLAASNSTETPIPPPTEQNLDTGLGKVDQLLKGQISIESFATEVSQTEQNRQNPQPEKNSAKEKLQPFILITSALCVSGAAAIFAFNLILLLARTAASIFACLRSYCARIFNHRKTPDDSHPSQAELEDDNMEKTDPPKEALSDLDHSSDTPEIEKLYCDKKSLTPKDPDPAHTGGISTAFNTTQVKKAAQKKPLPDKAGQPTETVKEVLSEYSQPVETTLAELAQQVAAIREYTSYQYPVPVNPI